MKDESDDLKEFMARLERGDDPRAAAWDMLAKKFQRLMDENPFTPAEQRAAERIERRMMQRRMLARMTGFGLN